jgi:hypothetical protein
MDSASVLQSPAARTSLVAASESNAPSRGWLVGPWFDLLLIANVAWPLLVLVQVGEGFSGREGVQFWQLYYITTPHRWITLALVFLDRGRFQERRGLFLLIAAAVAAICVGVRVTTGALTCLLTIDYVWNAWHFASQHHGIYRIYARRGRPAMVSGLAVEKWAMRMFLLYVILRVAAATWPYPTVDRWFAACDWLVIGVPAWLLYRDIARSGGVALGRTAYLVSVSGLYLSLLWAVHTRQPALVLSLATASALFHAIEYLSLVSWSVRDRHDTNRDQMGMLGFLATRWTIALGIFVVILGASGWLMEQRWMQTWLLINVVVAFLHYAYDGLIWRQRPTTTRPAVPLSISALPAKQI